MTWTSAPKFFPVALMKFQVQVKLMRRMQYLAPYMYETIRPKKVYDAAHCLIQSQVCRDEGVVLSEEWSRCDEGKCLGNICVMTFIFRLKHISFNITNEIMNFVCDEIDAPNESEKLNMETLS